MATLDREKPFCTERVTTITYATVNKADVALKEIDQEQHRAVQKPQQVHTLQFGLDIERWLNT